MAEVILTRNSIGFVVPTKNFLKQFLQARPMLKLLKKQDKKLDQL